MDNQITVLVVEDDPILKNLLGHTFSSSYHMLYAGNGVEAFAVLDTDTPSLILLDLMMPDMDGFTFLEKLHERTDAAKDIPVIVVSNLGQQENIDKAKSLGAVDYLVKAEVSMEDIVKRIEEVLTARAEGTTISTAAEPSAPGTIKEPSTPIPETPPKSDTQGVFPPSPLT